MTGDLKIIPNLIGGVSQQPDSIRLDTQMEEQINAYGTVLEGLCKRPPTRWLAEISQDEFGPMRLHTIERDRGEAYLVALGHQNLRVFDLEGREFDVVNGPSVVGINFDYLDLRREAHDITDIGVWTNDAQAFVPSNLGSSNHPLGESSNVYALTNIVQVGAMSANWTRASTAKVLNGKMLVSVFVSDGGYTNVPETVVLSLTDTTAADSATATFRYASGVWDAISSVNATSFGLETVGNGWHRLWMVVDPDYPGSGITAGNALELGINTADTDGTVQRSIQATAPPLVLGASELIPHYLGPEEIRTLTVQDTTIVSAPGQTMAEDSTTTTAFDDTVGLIHVRQGAYSTDYNVTIENGSNLTFSATCETYDGVAATGSEISSIDTQDIATELAASITTAGVAFGVSATSHGSLVILSAPTSKLDAVSTSDGIGDAGLQAVFKEIQSFADLPEEGVDGFKIEVVGNTGSDSDDYWLEFTTEIVTDNGTGKWRETVAPGAKFQLDPETMPHKLSRLQDDASGTVTGTPGAIYFEWDVNTWEGREVGDEETNLAPSFVGQTVRDLCFHENRLGILAGPSIVLSSSGSYFNFYRTTVQSLPDDDPIDARINSADVGLLDSAMPFQGRLVIHTEEGQWGMTAENFLSPSSFSINRLHSYESKPRVGPVSTGSSLVFPFIHGQYTGFREVVRLDENTFDAYSISQQIPRYLDPDIDFMAVSTVSMAIVAGKRGGTELYVFKWYTDGGRRIQSAWSKFQSGGDKFLDAVAINDSLYFLVERAEGIHLERMNLWIGETADPIGIASQDPFIPHLDQHIRLTDPDVSYSNRGPTELDVTLPFRLDSNQTYKAVGLVAGIVHDVTVTGTNTCYIDGVNAASQSVQEYVIGIQYDMDVSLATPTYRQESENGGRVQIGDARIKLHRGYLFVNETGYVEVEVTIPEGTSTLSVGDSTNFEPNEGDQRFPILARASDTSISFKNSSPFPSRLTNLELNGRVARRASRR